LKISKKGPNLFRLQARTIHPRGFRTIPITRNGSGEAILADGVQLIAFLLAEPAGVAACHASCAGHRGEA
jgi:hypothetical protein